MAKAGRKKGRVAGTQAGSEKERVQYEIERQKREFNEHQCEARSSSQKTIDQTNNSIVKLENFLGDREFTCLDRKIAKAFKDGLCAETNPRTGRPYAASYVTKILQDNKRFLEWIRDDLDRPKKEFRKAIAFFAPSSGTQKAARSRGPKQTPKLEDVIAAILAMPSSTIVQRRDRAMMALLLLTGMRDGAQSGMLIGAVDLAQGVICQRQPWVDTKFAKEFDTWFFPVGEDILAIFTTWVVELTETERYQSGDPLFPQTAMGQDPNGLLITTGLTKSVWKQAHRLRTVFREAMANVGLNYRSPHSVRRTLAALGEQRCRTPEEFKAWSQNLGHDDVLMTFIYYGEVPSERQAELIRSLHAPRIDSDRDALLSEASAAAAALRAAVERLSKK